jgi:tetratricopeptide (TPR) repeat protein
LIPVLLFGEISKEIHSKLSEVKNLIAKNSLLKADLILKRVLEKAGSREERDLINYFQANLYLLQGNSSLATLLLNSILQSKLLNREILNEVEREVVNLHMNRKEFYSALQFVKSVDGRENVAMKYKIYKGLGDFRESYRYLEILIDGGSKNFEFWEDYIMFLQSFGIENSKIDTSSLLLSLSYPEEFQTFTSIFEKYKLYFHKAEFLHFGIENGFLRGSKNEILDVLQIYKSFGDLYNLERFLNTLIALERIPEKEIFQIELAKLYLETGDFEKVEELLQNIESGEKYMILGELFQLLGMEAEAQKSFLRATHFPETRGESLKMLQD